MTLNTLNIFWRSKPFGIAQTLKATRASQAKGPHPQELQRIALKIKNIKTINIKLSESAPSMRSSQTVNLESITIIAKER
jgi:hypothetical protein